MSKIGPNADFQYENWSWFVMPGAFLKIWDSKEASDGEPKWPWTKAKRSSKYSYYFSSKFQLFRKLLFSTMKFLHGNIYYLFVFFSWKLFGEIKSRIWLFSKFGKGRFWPFLSIATNNNATCAFLKATKTVKAHFSTRKRLNVYFEFFLYYDKNLR